MPLPLARPAARPALPAAGPDEEVTVLRGRGGGGGGDAGGGGRRCGTLGRSARGARDTNRSDKQRGGRLLPRLSRQLGAPRVSFDSWRWTRSLRGSIPKRRRQPPQQQQPREAAAPATPTALPPTLGRGATMGNGAGARAPRQRDDDYTGATVRDYERKSKKPFVLIKGDEMEIDPHRQAVQDAIQAKVAVGRWRAAMRAPRGGRIARRVSEHDARGLEQYAGGRRSRQADGSRLSTLAKLGDYKILQKLGEGSFAQVRLAEHVPTGQRVAIKLFDKTKKLSEYEMKNFYREATVLQRVQSVHTCEAYQFLDAEYVYGLVFELIKTDLLADVRANGPYSSDKARVTIRQVIAGVEAVHAADLVHRDLKLENIGVDFAGRVKLLDFGLAGDIRGKDALETQCGTMMYSAPELLAESPYGKQVDIWSIGVVLYSLMFGRLPYDDGTGGGMSLTQLHAKMLDHQYDLPDCCCESLRELFRRLLEVKPAKRITCEGLWENAWICNVGEEGGAPLPPITLASTSTAVTTSSINMALVEKIAARSGVSAQVCAQAVIQHRCDPLCGEYHLLHRMNESGGDGGGPASSPARQRKERTSRLDTIKSMFQRRSKEGDPPADQQRPRKPPARSAKRGASKKLRARGVNKAPKQVQPR